MPKRRRAGRIRPHPALWRFSGRGLRRRPVRFFALAGLITVFAASAPRAQTLTQALAEAYNNNPQLLAQRALLRATDEQVPQALSFWRPTVNFTGQVGMATASVETQSTQAARAAGFTRTVDHAITRPDALTFQLTQPIYRGGRTEAQTRQAINDYLSQRNDASSPCLFPGRGPAAHLTTRQYARLLGEWLAMIDLDPCFMARIHSAGPRRP